ncbi:MULTISPECIES: sigma factor-like helix-turn-helix DNA-binding protein [Enterobacteriaceae]|uniref:Helix-turn-helix domain-containing protein n=1 Tax=Enterobacter asburiae TaxID=61645 RepID=A0A7W3HFN3_ENTAS|nr:MULTISPECIES: sigma factor-like helix-turn-helix DNA-binding protein [Enterobacteriaceae]MBA7984643.1 helix-turn-helix domain-containing protein [Enterobacter asburiae]MBA8079233.1 helix-turn-helix domain-containing protein [Enterobacter asburiae]MEB7943550.1 helix-turn-helix domain-containing protein [Raoultella ornithinolytica]
MFNTDNLPNQFDDTPSDLNKIDSIMWASFKKGYVPAANDLQAPAMKVLYDRYRAQHGRNDMKAAIADKLKAEANIRRIAMQNPNRISLNQSQVTCAVRTSLDVYCTGETQPAIGIVRDLLPGKDVKPVMNRPQQRKRMKKALKANADHPAIITAQKQGNPIRMDADTLSSGLMSLQNAAMVIRKLNDHEQRLVAEEATTADLARRVAELEARLMSVETGASLPEQALAMRDSGKRQQEIATALGVSVNTVKSWLRRNR